MMALLQPERGGRKPLSERLGVDCVCRGTFALSDPSSAPWGGYADLWNARVSNDVINSRGGCSKRNSALAMDAAVVGGIDTDGEFD